MEKKVPAVSDPSHCLLVLMGAGFLGLCRTMMGVLQWLFFVSIAILLEIFRADSLRQAV